MFSLVLPIPFSYELWLHRINGRPAFQSCSMPLNIFKYISTPFNIFQRLPVNPFTSQYLSAHIHQCLFYHLPVSIFQPLLVSAVPHVHLLHNALSRLTASLRWFRCSDGSTKWIWLISLIFNQWYYLVLLGYIFKHEVKFHYRIDEFCLFLVDFSMLSIGNLPLTVENRLKAAIFSQCNKSFDFLASQVAVSSFHKKTIHLQKP